MNDDDLKKLTDQAQWDQLMASALELGKTLTKLIKAFKEAGFDDEYSRKIAQQMMLKGFQDALFKKDGP